jgi:hypothetical protein
MSSRHDVEVLTTCARDYLTWRNEYPEGRDRVRGVTVHRFANARTRDIEAFNRYSEWIYTHPHQPDDEMEWLRQQGPWCPALIDYLQRNHRDYDALVFFTYLYAPTVLGMRVAPDRSILVPTAHDEPPIHLGIYQQVFALPAGIAFNTDVERAFISSTFRLKAAVQDTVGCGVDLPQHFGLAAPVVHQRGDDVRRTGHVVPGQCDLQLRIARTDDSHQRHRTSLGYLPFHEIAAAHQINGGLDAD